MDPWLRSEGSMGKWQNFVIANGSIKFYSTLSNDMELLEKGELDDKVPELWDKLMRYVPHLLLIDASH